MEARRRWATGVVTALAIVAGGGGAAYLWKEGFTTGAGDEREGGLVGDASIDVRAGRGKSKSAKRGDRSGKPRVGARPNAASQGGQGATGGSGAGGGGLASDDEGDDGPGDEPNGSFQPPFRGRGPAGPTYEAAMASNKQEITIGGRAEPDLTDAQLASPMRNGGFVGECGAPQNMKVTVKVAIKTGHPAGVSVATSPADPDVAGCIDRYVRTFAWPSSAKMDSFTTTY